jgi:hypothetical protein
VLREQRDPAVRAGFVAGFLRGAGAPVVRVDDVRDVEPFEDQGMSHRADVEALGVFTHELRVQLRMRCPRVRG